MNTYTSISFALLALLLTIPNSQALNVKTVDIDYSKLATSKPQVDKSKPQTITYADRNATGAVVTTKQVVYPRVNATGNVKTSFNANGREFQMSPLPPTTILEGVSMLARPPLNWYGEGPVVVYRPSSSDTILPSPLMTANPGAHYRTNLAELKKKGYRVLGQLGASYKAQDKHGRATSLRYVRYNSQPIDPKVGQSAPNIIQSGIVKYKDGTIKYLDFCQHTGKGNTSEEKLEDVKRNVMRPALDKLQKDPTVEYFSIDTHCVIRKEGDHANIVVRGGYKRGGPFLDHQTGLYARSVRVFNDKTKIYVGSMITPSLLMKDALVLAKKEFGPNAVVQHLDGDAFAATYFQPKRTLPIKDSLAYQNHYNKEGMGQEFIVTKN